MPRVPPPGAGTGGTVASKPKPTPQHSIFVVMIAELIGIALMALLADLNEGLGKVLMYVMVGWLLLWLMLNAKQIQGLFGKLQG